MLGGRGGWLEMPVSGVRVGRTGGRVPPLLCGCLMASGCSNQPVKLKTNQLAAVLSPGSYSGTILELFWNYSMHTASYFDDST